MTGQYATYCGAISLAMEEVFARAAACVPELVWLDSAIGDQDRGERSVLVLAYRDAVAIRARDVRGAGPAFGGETLAELDRRFGERAQEGAASRLGWFGFAAYEAACLFDGAFTLPERVDNDELLVWCAEARVAAIAGAGAVELVCAAQTAEEALASFHWWRARLEGATACPAAGDPPRPAGAQLTRAAYAVAFAAVQEAIARGDVYQACLTYAMELEGPYRLDGEYLRLRARYGGDYSAYVRVAGVELASLSPERFLRVRGREVVARPMKGTRAAGGGAAAEEQAARDLHGSEKERAENVMIVDLMRSDLGRVCEVGSVTVPRLFEVERYRTVLQLTSTVCGVLRGDVGPFALLRATFPPGSMTGAPKIAACRLLGGLEGRARGLYSGSVFWLGLDGRWDFSVVIRSLQRWGGVLRWDTGGGIVADSVLDAEWRETRLKASPVLPSEGDVEGVPH